MRKNEVMYETPPIITNVSGDVYTTHPYNPASNEKFQYLKAIDQATNTNYYTDANGDVDFGSVASGTSIRYKLEGLYADVQTNSNTPDMFENLGTTNNIIFNNTNSTIQERSAYHAVNKIHDHLKSVFPTLTQANSGPALVDFTTIYLVKPSSESSLSRNTFKFSSWMPKYS